MYAHPCAGQGCTVVVIGLRARLLNWIVWNCKDKYRQAVCLASSPVDGVDNACRFRPTRCKPHPEGLRIKAVSRPGYRSLRLFAGYGLAVRIAHRLALPVPRFDWAASGKLQVMRALGMSIDPPRPVTAATRSVVAPCVKAYPPSNSPL